jgi:hypothetical protein
VHAKDSKVSAADKGKPHDQASSEELEDEPLSAVRDKAIAETLARVPKDAQPAPNEKRGKFNYTKSNGASKTKIQIQSGT